MAVNRAKHKIHQLIFHNFHCMFLFILDFSFSIFPRLYCKICYAVLFTFQTNKQTKNTLRFLWSQIFFIRGHSTHKKWASFFSYLMKRWRRRRKKNHNILARKQLHSSTSFEMCFDRWTSRMRRDAANFRWNCIRNCLSLLAKFYCRAVCV